ncbi:sarcosine oxidase [Apiospora phragmitis]|uniref:Sarcosine oxidase n=1 Tax=Apiospora phragmitis TaxID=2905665 RepID=A0ABR1W5C5_9PEZI
MKKEDPILILGAGTFGLSTAYHFAKAGFSNITVLEKSTAVPPVDSAGNDLNKIIRAEYEDPFYAELALQAIEAWKTPLFAPYYHETGYLLANSRAAPEKAKKTLLKSLGSIQQHPAFRGKISPIEKREDVTKVAPVFDGPMEWKGYFNRFAGYAHAADALTAVYSACCALGVKFCVGDAVASLTYSATRDRCTGAATASGKTYTASVTVLALGAALATVLPDVGKQVAANAWPVAHIQLTPAEAQKLHGIPVTYARDLGFFFEPDRRTNLLKLCPSGAGYTNFSSSGGGASVPPDFNGFITPADEDKIRRLLRETLPGLAERPLVNKHMCWCADTADSEYIIDFVPGKHGLIVASGDSGHAFKMLPIAGKWIVELAQAGQQEKRRWRWKPNQDAGGDVSWRVGRPVDLKDVPLAVRSKL